MNQTHFIDLLQQPQEVNKNQTSDLKSILDTFPYFQSARAMYLRGLKNAESFKYNQALKTTAAYTTDRNILFDFITAKTFKQNEISNFIRQNTSHIQDVDVTIEDISMENNVVLDSALQQQFEETKDIFDPTLFQPKIEHSQVANFKTTVTESLPEKIEVLPIEEKKEDIKEEIAEKEIEVIPVEKKEVAIAPATTPSDILELGKPFNFEQTETHSFNEWLNLTSLKPIERKEDKKDLPTIEKDEEQENKILTRDKKFALIEQFISSNPKLGATKKSASNHNIAKAQMIKPEALMTETLARIYVEQKNFKKAIQSYKILSLKYPEKSGFFADQIKAVKQIQEQNNTK